MKVLNIGILSQELMRERTLAIAAGKLKPKPNDPKIWFPSIKSMAQVLSDENQALLKVIADTKPNSISELQAATGRALSNLSRTLKTLANYGIIFLVKENNRIKPVAKATTFHVTFGIE